MNKKKFMGCVQKIVKLPRETWP